MKLLTLSILTTIATLTNSLDIRKHNENEKHGWQLTTVSD
jgi:hypothetical protein